VLGAFQKATGLEVRLVALNSQAEGRLGSNAFCRWLNGVPAQRAACQRTHSRLRQKVRARPQPCKLECFAGLTELAVPVKLGAAAPAMLRCGQVFRKRPTEKGFQRMMESLRGDGAMVDGRRVHKLYFGTAVASAGRLRAATALLEILAKHLAEAAQQAATAPRDEAPASIVRAKEFVQQHLGEKIHTRQAAERACLSLQHFCREFKAATGMTFTEYAAGLRIEKARQLLAEPRLRISEVAYECGFRSIPHFDRVFKRHTGRSPTAYRDRQQARLT
jgi:AraC-like DNA-binding protein